MCVVSNIGDTYGDRNLWPWRPGRIAPPPPEVPRDFRRQWEEVTRNQETEELKKRVKALEDLLRKGKEFDAATGQPDCELEAKKESIRKIAEEMGVAISFP